MESLVTRRLADIERSAIKILTVRDVILFSKYLFSIPPRDVSRLIQRRSIVVIGGGGGGGGVEFLSESSSRLSPPNRVVVPMSRSLTKRSLRSSEDSIEWKENG